MNIQKNKLVIFIIPAFLITISITIASQANTTKITHETGFATPTLCKSPEWIERDQLVSKIKNLLKLHKFDELERIAAKYRSSQECYPTGYWKLWDFYSIVSRTVSGDDSDPEKSSHYDFSTLSTWIKEKPASITPRVAYAEALKNYAWAARGSGYANTVSPTAWGEFDKRLKAAHKFVGDSWNLSKDDPCLASVMLIIYLGEQAPKSLYDKVFNEATAKWPNYLGYYARKAHYLLPRWSGEEGEWQSFLKESSDKLGGEKGDLMYTQVMWTLYDNYREPTYQEPHVDKDRVIRGFKALEKKYPKSLWVISAECKAAAELGMTEIADSYMQRLKNRVDIVAWHDIDCFKKVQQFIKDRKKNQHP